MSGGTELIGGLDRNSAYREILLLCISSAGIRGVLHHTYSSISEFKAQNLMGSYISFPSLLGEPSLKKKKKNKNTNSAGSKGFIREVTLALRKGRLRDLSDSKEALALALAPAGRPSSLGPAHMKALQRLGSKGSFVKSVLGRCQWSAKTCGGSRGRGRWASGFRSTSHQLLTPIHEASGPTAPDLCLRWAGAPFVA